MSSLFEELCQAYLQFDDRSHDHSIQLYQTIYTLPRALGEYLNCPKTYSMSIPTVPENAVSGEYVGLCGYDGSKKNINYGDLDFNEDGEACFGIYVTLERQKDTFPKRAFYYKCKARVEMDNINLTVLDKEFVIPRIKEEPQNFLPAFEYMKDLLLESLSYNPFVGDKTKQRIGFLP